MATDGFYFDNVGVSLRRYYIDRFHFRHVGSIARGSRVLDLGGHRTRKRGLFDLDRYGLRVTYADLSNAKSPDVQADARRLPFRAEVFDVVVCSELLEHVPDPAAVLQEVRLVLRARGALVVCAPFFYPVHGDPDDYGRYTQSYWRETLTRCGFSEIAVERQGGFWSVLVDLLRSYVAEGLVEPTMRQRLVRVPLRLLMPFLKRRAVALDERTVGGFALRFATGYGVVARKS